MANNVCLECGEGTLEFDLSITKTFDLGQKNGAIVLPPKCNVKQEVWKQMWTEQEIRGPMFCKACKAEHFYVPGAKKPLMLGSHEEASTFGAAAFLEE